MQSPNPFGNSSGPDPFIFKDEKMIIPTGAQMVPVENQEPHAKQYCLSHPREQGEFDALLARVFEKRAIIWSMEKNWTKEGDCMIAVFYSNIVKKKTQETGSYETFSVGEISPEICEKSSKKEDELFEEFAKFAESMAEEEKDNEED